MSVGANQHRVQTIILQGVEGGVERIIPNGYIAIHASVKHTKRAIEVGRENDLVIFQFQVVN